MKGFRIIAAAFAAAFLAVQASAEDEAEFAPPRTLEELDARIAEEVAESGVIGLQVAMVDKTGATWAKSYGWLDKEKTRPAANEAIFRAGSISKSVTGALAQILVEDGVLDLNARLHDAVPEIRFDNKWEATDPVRLVHLSEHTTGWDDIQFSEYRGVAPEISLVDGLAINPKARVNRWKPGLYAVYNNAGPAALAAAMERVTGDAYDAMVDERIFAPLGIERASFFLNDEIAANMSKSYSASGIEEPYVHIAMRPSGSLNISASELAKFVAFLIRRGEANGVQIISPEGVTRMETPTTSLAARAGLKLGYGLGVYGFNVEDRVFYGHNGGIDGFLAEYGYSHETATGYVIMSNTAKGEPLLAIRKLVASYLLATGASAAPAPEIVKDADLSGYKGVYRQLTPGNEMLRPLLDLVDFIIVTPKDGGLEIKNLVGGPGVIATPVAGEQFIRKGRNTPDRIIVETPEGETELLYFFQNAYRKTSPAVVYGRVAIMGVAIFMSFAAILFALIWCVARPFGAFRASNRWRVWIWPMLAILSVALAVVVGIAAASGSSATMMARLGGPTIWSLAITAATIALPVFSLLGVAAAFMTKSASGFARIHAGATSLSLTALSLLLASYGWIGMTIWSYRPAIAGV